ncbi:VirB4 family type IV secretion system protein [Nitrosopumilus sp.]|uniref:VirB4 family type IV secretion system protein n=1 Tax=Nitrosopumilus sp. TaxID=2024843 RepID=UPI00292D1791|nr:ATP-binding protein [Nitrosopumilus sp.]
MKLQLPEKSQSNKEIIKDINPKKKRSSTDFTYSYSIIPTNFINLSEESQVQRLGQFFDILNVIDDKIKITMSRRIILITVEGQIRNMPVMQVHVESHVPLADTLEQNRLEYISGVIPPQFRILKEHFSMLEIVEIESNEDDGDVTLTTGEKIYSKTFTLDSIPATLPYAWITKIFGICSQIQMWINPLDKDEAITRMVRFKNIIYDDAKNNRITSELYKRADDTENSIRKDSTRLYEVIVNCTVVGDTRKTLKENVKTFKKHLKRYGGHFSAVSAKQAAMLLEGFGKKITFDRDSCAILYSFASADMLEIPDGIPLGINMDSKGPIIFDIGKRTNYNIAVIGKSGSGKSFTVKILLNRLLKKFPESYVYVIDPMGEYSRIADYFGGGMDVLYLKDEKDQLGLDPFVLLDPLDAADILAEITNASDDVKRQFQTYCGKAKSFEEFFKLIPKKYQSSLINLKKGPLSRIILGEPKLNSQRKVIMSMEGATGSETEQMILLLLLNKIFKICNELPAKTRKIVLIDEAWMLLRMKNAAKYVNMIVRMGRKLNITFGFISQRLEDISKEDETGIGKIIDNMETKIILGLEEQAAETAQDVLRLSDSETNKIRAFNAGHALFFTKNHRIHAKFEATNHEKEMFDTRPLE